MGPRALKGGGTAAALVLLALYLLIGGDLDLGGGEGTTTSTTTPTVSAPPPGPDAAEQDAGGAQPQQAEGDARVSDEEAAAIAATLALIDSGDPLPHEQDGSSFQNREGRLPQRPQGHYREYTVPTPGSEDRGARRLVIGAEGESFYTRDHYGSFIEIDPEDFR